MDPTRETRAGPKTDLSLALAACETSTLAAVLRGEEFLLFDGAMGTQLQSRGLAAGELPELLCLTNPTELREVHAAYVAAGAEVVTTNTFGANATKLGGAASVEEVFSAAVSCAREAGARYVAATLAPRVSSLRPWARFPSTTHTTSLPSRCVPPTLPVQTSL